MSGTATKKMLRVYEQSASPSLFLSGMFQSPPGNFHNSESVEIDVVRSQEEVAIVIEDISTGYRMNATDIYTNKEFVPPILKEAIALNAFDLLKREPGVNPFADQGFQTKATARFMRGIPKVEAKIRRTIELQASQVLQLGVVTLIDSNGTALYTIDYKPKSTHLPTAGVGWATIATATPLADLEALAEVIRNDGLSDPDQLIFGTTAWANFIENAKVQALLNFRRADMAGISPSMHGSGGTFQGWIWIGNYRFEMWTYGGRYTHPQTGAATPYVAADKVVMRASDGRLDATFGSIPRVVPADQRVLSVLPGRLSSSAGGMDLFPNAWVSDDGENLFAGVGSRPLMIPTAIDTYGCLDTQP